MDTIFNDSIIKIINKYIILLHKNSVNIINNVYNKCIITNKVPIIKSILILLFSSPLGVKYK